MAETHVYIMISVKLTDLTNLKLNKSRRYFVASSRYVLYCSLKILSLEPYFESFSNNGLLCGRSEPNDLQNDLEH